VLFGLEWAVANGMGRWTIASLAPCKYYVDGAWTDSTDPHGLVWVLDEVSSCTYDCPVGNFCVLSVMDRAKMTLPFTPTRKHPAPPKHRVLDPNKRFMLQVHDADDGFWENFYPEFPAEDLKFLEESQPLSLENLRRVFCSTY